MPRERSVTDISQPEMRDILNYGYNIWSEEVVKYAYDYYTYAMGIHPIRKKKTRAKVAREFHASMHGGDKGKKAVQKIVNEIIKHKEKEDGKV